MTKDFFPQPSVSARAKFMAREVKERLGSIDPSTVIRKDALFQVMRSSLTAWVRLPEVDEMLACLNTLVKDGVLKKVKDPIVPVSQWSEPVFQIVVPQKPLKPIKASPKGKGIYYYGTHKCERCGLTIEGKGRHGKSSRGHGKAICDAAMVAAMMVD